MSKRFLGRDGGSSPKKELDSIGPEGGPYCRHLDSEEESRSFDATCRKLYQYLLECADASAL